MKYSIIILFSVIQRTMSCIKLHTIKNLGLPICSNCIHFIEYKNNYPYDPVPDSSFSKCKKFGEKDLVNGEITYKYASLCRDDELKCGIKGVFYEENKELK